MAVQPLHRAVRSRLRNFAGLAALVGTRIRPAGTPGATTKPFVTYQIIDTFRERTMGPTYDLARSRVQINAWSREYDDTYDVAAQIHAALRGFSGTEASVEIRDSHPIDEDDAHDPEGKLHGRRLDYLIWYVET